MREVVQQKGQLVENKIDKSALTYIFKMAVIFFLGRFIGFFGFIFVMGIIGAMAT